MLSRIKKCLKDKAGLTLVELLCAIAIMGIVTTSVGSALVTSSQSYSRGTMEIDVQQEAQLLSNQISNLIIDATSGVHYEDNVLNINQNETKYEIIYSPEEQTVYYKDSDYGEEKHVLAENVSAFKADTTDYDINGMVYLDIAIEKNNRQFASSFAVASRNRNTSPNEIVPSISSIDKIILEPNQTYQFEAKAIGVDDVGLNWAVELSGSKSTVITNDGLLTIDKDEDKSMFFVKISTKETDGSGQPKAIKHVRVMVRRVNDLKLYGMHTSGYDKMQGATYEVTTSLYGTNLEKDLGQEYDLDYVSPYTIKWNVTSNANDLYEIISKDDKKLKFKLKRNMNPGEKIHVNAIAEHPAGNNKTFKVYGDEQDTWSLVSRVVYVQLADGGMKRNTNTKQGDFTQAFDNLAVNELRKKYEFRFKPTDEEEWSIWYNNVAGNENDNMEINLRPDVTAAMIYYKDYDVQIRISIVDATGKTVWPTAEVDEEDYIIDATMNRVNVMFKSSILNFTDQVKFNDDVTIKVNKGQPFDLFEFSKSVGYEENDIRNNLDYIVEKYENGKWNPVPSNVVSVQKGVSCKLKFETDDRAGKYRVKVVSRDMAVFTLLDSGQPQKQDYKEDFILYNESTGDGIFYFNVE